MKFDRYRCRATTRRRSTHCGGPTRHSDGGVVPVFEPADCGNGLGLATTEAAEDEGPEPAPAERPPGDLFVDTVTANDGSLDRVLGVLDTEANGEGCISAERLLVDVGDAIIEVTGEDGGAELRKRQED